jgi:hypothetical protein
MLESKGDKQRDTGKCYIMRNFVLCKVHEMIFTKKKEKEICKACGTYREKRILCKVLVEKPAGKRPRGKTSTESTD